MKVVVAGATGAIGRPLVARLRAAGHEVVGLARTPRGALQLTEAGARPVIADVLDRTALLRAVDGIRADAVIHELTAYRLGPPTHYHSPGLRRTNILRTTGTRHLLDLAKSVGATRFLTQSLVSGYGLRDHGLDPVTEDSPFGRPQGDRADDSIEALRLAEQQPWDEPGLDAIALRYGLFYGPGASDLYVRALKLRLLPVPAGGTGFCGWLYVDDAAEATVAALERGRGGQAYNIVDDEPARWEDVFDALAAAVGARRPRRIPARLFRIAAPLAAKQMLDMSLRVSNAKAKSELRWYVSRHSYREGAATLRGR
ncbi:NAD-dependent epimerase/dehydratase family protein [Nocardia transvalensis]|uniref:NAD-dependent epimerase/dehydratase family protein n=1 Tax=Nocardia transvalensis TaxID=37333 RepID=UPI001893CE65|nr:NAD(P)-dependent oxidoreductase [Nocardia transvalensis]MBF6327024.1 NAD(P)-dependent oxidoreductase [Nocardia transvalensis]